jgi:hypothetical protein
MHNSEELFDQCVTNCGGARVTDIIGQSPSFKNADYFFEADEVVAELKSLQKDFLSDPQTQKKMHLLFNKWVNAGKVSPGFGQLVIRTDELPADAASELLGLFQTPLRRVLRDAERQIQETKVALKLPKALGLLCLANDGNFALDPEMTVFLLNRCLTSEFPTIEHVILFSANLVTAIGGIREHAYLFASIDFEGRRSIASELWERLFSQWKRVLEKAIGHPLPEYRLPCITPKDIGQSRFLWPDKP